jgi:hypothetical protein
MVICKEQCTVLFRHDKVINFVPQQWLSAHGKGQAGRGYSAGNIIMGSEGGIRLVEETVKQINRLWKNTDAERNKFMRTNC